MDPAHDELVDSRLLYMLTRPTACLIMQRDG